MAYSLGIDLGTTYSAAATAVGERVETFQLGERAATIPSIIVVLRADGEVLTGDAAERRSLAEPTRTREFKRRLGDPTPIILGGTPYGAEALIAHLLKDDRAGHDPDGQPARLDVVTHSGELRRIHRPARAGHPPGRHRERHAADRTRGGGYPLRRPGTCPWRAAIAVYDFGGGTFDATILRKTDDGFEQLGRPEGMERLGGSTSTKRSSPGSWPWSAPTGRPSTPTIRPRSPRSPVSARNAVAPRRRSRRTPTRPSPSPSRAADRDAPDARGIREIRPRITETIGALGRAAKSAGLDFDGLDRAAGRWLVAHPARRGDGP